MSGDVVGALRAMHEVLGLLRRPAKTDDPLVPPMVEALGMGLDELEAALDELHGQNDELQAIRAELQYERERYVDLFHNAPEAYVVTDTQGVVERANAAACELLGVPVDGLEGRLLGRFVRREDRPAYTHFLETLGEDSTSTELVVTPRNTAPVVVSAVVVSRRRPVGRSTELRWMLRDVTDARRAQASLQAAFARTREEVDELRDLDRWKDAFLAAAAHDLRAPLAIITTSVRTLMETHEAADATPLVRTIGAEAHRLARLLDDLLDLDRFTRGTFAAERETTHIAELVDDALALAGVDRGEVQVDAPAIVADLDPGRTRQIISNLVANAATHTPPGTPVRVAVALRGNDVEILVEDEGPGIPLELREEVFRPFVTRRAHEHDDLGTGLGLSLVRLFAELHGGTVRVEDGPRGGTRVIVRLPGRAAA